MECPRKVRASWRALLFLLEKEADGHQGVGSVWAQHPSRSSESMCLDRSAHDDRGEFRVIGKWLLCVVKQFG